VSFIAMLKVMVLGFSYLDLVVIYAVTFAAASMPEKSPKKNRIRGLMVGTARCAVSAAFSDAICVVGR
jgi:hypothetical protein